MRRFMWLAIFGLAGFMLALSSGGETRAGRPPQDVFVFAPDELDPGGLAGFRVVVSEPVSLLESRPVKGARVEIRLEGKRVSKRLLRGWTDSRGTIDASARIPELRPENDYELVIKVSSHLGETEKRKEVKLKPRFRILLSSDKPLYQPGQLIHLRAVALRESDLKAASRKNIILEVEDPQGNKVFKKTGKTDEFGVFAADFQLADEIRLGEYKLRAVMEDAEAERAIAVKRYALPKFKVELNTDKDYYRPGETVKGSLSARYFFGKPVAAGKVKVVAKAFDYEFHTVAESTGMTDDEGGFEFELSLPDYFAGQPLEKGDAFVVLEAEVTDTADHKETARKKCKVVSSDLRVELVPEAGRLIPGVSNTIYALAVSADDKPVKAEVRLSFPEGEKKAWTDDAGVAEFNLTPLPDWFRKKGSSYSIAFSVEAEDEQGRKVKKEQELSADNLRDTLLLRPDRALYQAGDSMTITALTTIQRGTVFLDLVRNRRTVLTKALDLKDGKARARLALPPELFGTLEVHGYVILPAGEIIRDTRVVYVEPANGLSVSVSLDQEVYRPGGTAKLRFLVTDDQGNPQAAVLGLAVVDESVFALQEMRPGLLKVYFTIQQELMKPRYELHFTPGSVSPADLLREEEESRARKDRLMKVLLAGVKEPSRPGWTENPARERLIEERDRIEAFGRAFLEWALYHPFLEKKNGEWAFREDIAERMMADGAIAKQEAYDEFGKPYSPALLAALDPSLSLTEISRAVTKARLARVYQALESYQEQEKSWLEKLFQGRQAPEALPSEELISLLVEKKLLKPGEAEDPWGTRWLVRSLEEPIENPYDPAFNRLELRSAGPDQTFHTPDDITDPRPGEVNPMLFSMWEGTKFYRPWFFFEAERPRFLKAMPVMKFAAAGPGVQEGARAEARPSAPAGKTGQAEPRLRQFFPETLFWNPALVTDRNGRAELEIPLADSITSWRLTALGHTRNGLLGSTTAGIRVFQDFFVDIDFPAALTKGDEVSVPVQLYNYLPAKQKVSLEVKDHPGFELLSPGAAELVLSPGEVTVHYFKMKAGRVGRGSVTVYARGGKMSDAVKRSVEILPDGLRMETVKNGRLGGKTVESVEIPAFAVPGSYRVMVKVYPGVFSQVLEGLDGLFRMPFGCFEQTTSVTYPNVMLLAYMKKTGIISPEVQMKAESYINIGYQRLLSFEVPGGGFEWFGNPPAHKVLTAYGLMEFYDMSKVYEIDESVISRTQEWLVNQQEPDGTWKPAEHWMETLSGDAFSRSVLLNTAYIAWALAETGYRGDALDKALRWLKAHVKESKDAYTLALALNAFVAADPGDRQARELMRRLDALKMEDPGGMVHWEPKGKTAVNGSGKSANIETTALILYAMIKARMFPHTVNRGLSWLAAQKDSFGTFQTTQATILALKALIAAEENRAPEVNAEVKVKVNGKEEIVRITPETSDVMRVLDFKQVTRTGANRVEIEAPEDIGLAYQVAGVYYLPWSRVKKEGKAPFSLQVSYDRSRLRAGDILTATVVAEAKTEKPVDMAILDLGIPPGFELLPDALQKLKAEGKIEKFTATGRQLTVYVRRMERGKPLRFSYELRAKFPVKAQTPKSTVYEYYNPDRRTEAPPVKIEVVR